MTVAYLCVVVAALVPLICVGYAKFSTKGYDNRSPREFLERLEGKAKRAHYAQLNGYEVFAPFAAAVIIAHQLHAPQERIDLLAAAFVWARIFYCIFYIQDMHVWRSFAWFTGFFLTLALFFVGLK